MPPDFAKYQNSDLYCVAPTAEDREEWLRVIKSCIPASASEPKRVSQSAGNLVLGQTGTWEQSVVIGTGAYAQVRLGFNMDDRTKVAIKIIRNEAAGSGTMMRLKREIEIMHKLDHPNVIRVRHSQQHFS